MKQFIQWKHGSKQKWNLSCKNYIAIFIGWFSVVRTSQKFGGSARYVLAKNLFGTVPCGSARSVFPYIAKKGPKIQRGSVRFVWRINRNPCFEQAIRWEKPPYFAFAPSVHRGKDATARRIACKRLKMTVSCLKNCKKNTKNKNSWPLAHSFVPNDQ